MRLDAFLQQCPEAWPGLGEWNPDRFSLVRRAPSTDPVAAVVALTSGNTNPADILDRPMAPAPAPAPVYAPAPAPAPAVYVDSRATIQPVSRTDYVEVNPGQLVSAPAPAPAPAPIPAPGSSAVVLPAPSPAPAPAPAPAPTAPRSPGSNVSPTLPVGVIELDPGSGAGYGGGINAPSGGGAAGGGTQQGGGAGLVLAALALLAAVGGG